jgi:hypothetical protein
VYKSDRNPAAQPVGIQGTQSKIREDKSPPEPEVGATYDEFRTSYNGLKGIKLEEKVLTDLEGNAELLNQCFSDSFSPDQRGEIVTAVLSIAAKQTGQKDFLRNVYKKLCIYEDEKKEPPEECNECSICFESLHINNMEKVHLGCEPIPHWFHSKCIGKWLTQNSTCPFCKSTITDDIIKIFRTSNAVDTDPPQGYVDDVRVQIQNIRRAAEERHRQEQSLRQQVTEDDIANLHIQRFLVRTDSSEITRKLIGVGQGGIRGIPEDISYQYNQTVSNLHPTLRKMVYSLKEAATFLRARNFYDDVMRHKRILLFYSLIYLAEVSGGRNDNDKKLEYYGVKKSFSPFLSKSLIRVLFFANSVSRFVDASCNPNPRWMFTDRFDKFENLFTHNSTGADAENVLRSSNDDASLIDSFNVYPITGWNSRLGFSVSINDPLESALAIYCTAKHWINNPDHFDNLEIPYFDYVSSIWTYAVVTLPSYQRDNPETLTSRVPNCQLLTPLISITNPIQTVLLNSLGLTQNATVLAVYNRTEFPHLAHTDVFLNACMRGYVVGLFTTTNPGVHQSSILHVIRKYSDDVAKAKNILENISTRVFTGYDQLFIAVRNLIQRLEVAREFRQNTRPSGGGVPPAAVAVAVASAVLCALSAAIPR